VGQYIRLFEELNRSDLPIVGGKGANLGEMTQAGFPVPPGFCVTTEAYRLFTTQSESFKKSVQQLEQISFEQQDEIRKLGAQIRKQLQTLPLPEEIVEEVRQAWRKLGRDKAFAVRSSATAEDLPTASFAGQQDTFLNVRGETALIEAIRQCFASLFTERAILYRSRNQFGHHAVALSVVVQQMVFPEVSGILFTADPVTGHREVVSIDASFGLGEALVSGIVSADLYQVRQGEIIKQQIAEKKIAIQPLPDGGTQQVELPKEKQMTPALTSQQVKELATLGKQVEQYYGQPQDMEWAIEEGKIYLLQTRPITSLYPLPERNDQALRVFISFGHIQMMTDAMKPLALSLFRTVFPLGKQESFAESQMMVEAGSRLFVDFSTPLQIKLIRRRAPLAIRNLLDPQIADAVEQFVKRKAFLNQSLSSKGDLIKGLLWFLWYPFRRFVTSFLFGRPEKFRQKMGKILRKQLAESQAELQQVEGSQRIQLIQKQVGRLLTHLVKYAVPPYVVPGIVASVLLRDRLRKWLGREEGISVLNKSLTGNVTSEMGLALGDVAEKARPYPELIQYLSQSQKKVDFQEGLSSLPGGEAFQQAFDQFLQQYGVRCSGEIDISRPRWKEQPQQLLPSILSHLQQMKPREHRQRFAKGEKEAEEMATQLLQEVRAQRWGWWKQLCLRRLIRLFRHGIALREHHKLAIVQHFDLYKEVILSEARKWVAEGILFEEEDVFFLRFQELIDIAEGRVPTHLEQLIQQRKADYMRDIDRKPPRVFTSQGEVLIARQTVDSLPPGTLMGTPVSSGVFEGTAKVVLSPEQADLEEGEILVAPFTDPGWTPLFLSAKALVLEVGGMMTHGAVVAREYGIPAVVGIDDATKKIQTGQRIRVDGDRGYVEIIEQEDH
jgi:pyruvate,water dikinase